MNILGIGGPELLVIFIIMLLVAGPKRMIHWAYILGQYVAKFRVMWSETVDMVQQEFDQADIDIKIPKTPPTKASIQQQVNSSLDRWTAPPSPTQAADATERGKVQNAEVPLTQHNGYANGNGFGNWSTSTKASHDLDTPPDDEQTGRSN